MELDLTGRAALITGGGTGIGLGIARQLLSQGATVVLAGRRAAVLQQAQTELAAGARCQIEPLDIVDCGACGELIRRLAKADGPTGGRLDILVNNAGQDLLMPLAVSKPEAIETAVAVNLTGTLFLTRAAIPLLSKNKPAGGVILSMASAAGLAGAIGRSVYGAAKAGVIGMTRALALELAPRKIRVNAIAPGVVNTELNTRAMAGLDETQRAAVAAAHPLGLGEITDVAQLAGFLCAPAARWITGQTIAVDGGLTA